MGERKEMPNRNSIIIRSISINCISYNFSNSRI
nr:MAG TPA: hypothetical protein [Crassvirales sp.]